MNSIARALNNIAISLNSIATAINNSKKVETKNTTITSNPTSAVTITSSTIPQIKDGDRVYVLKEEKEVLDAIYDALLVKGNHPEHHDYIMKELRVKWPVLFKALDKLIIIRKDKYNKSYKYQQKQDIWNTGSKNKWL